MPTATEAKTRRTSTKKPGSARGGRAKASARAAAPRTPRLGKRAHTKQVKERLHSAIRSSQSVSESETEATTVAVLAVVAELAAETAAVFGEVLARLETIERRMAG